MKCYYDVYDCMQWSGSKTAVTCEGCYRKPKYDNVITATDINEVTQKCPICKGIMSGGMRLMCDECYSALKDIIMERMKNEKRN